MLVWYKADIIIISSNGNCPRHYIAETITFTLNIFYCHTKQDKWIRHKLLTYEVFSGKKYSCGFNQHSSITHSTQIATFCTVQYNLTVLYYFIYNHKTNCVAKSKHIFANTNTKAQYWNPQITPLSHGPEVPVICEVIITLGFVFI